MRLTGDALRTSWGDSFPYSDEVFPTADGEIDERDDQRDQGTMGSGQRELGFAVGHEVQSRWLNREAARRCSSSQLEQADINATGRCFC